MAHQCLVKKNLNKWRDKGKDKVNHMDIFTSADEVFNLTINADYIIIRSF